MPFAFLIAAPAFCDLFAFLQALVRHGSAPERIRRRVESARLLFLVPAHNEALLIRRCVRSLLEQAYPPERMTVVVIADHCADDTADAARAAGARVLERKDGPRGKGHSLQWALPQLGSAVDSVVVVDADTVVAKDFARALAAGGDLQSTVVQTYDGMSNEFESWLTRLSGLLTRNRYDVQLPLKARAGLNCPLTGDGGAYGWQVLSRYGWNVTTVTDGWELYARYTTAGVRIRFEPAARFFAQEAKTLGEGASQRRRWQAGRRRVLRIAWKRILTAPGVNLLQRLDLLVELGSPAPIGRVTGATVGLLAVMAITPSLAWPLAALFITGIAQPAFYSCLSLASHPQPLPTILALARLPFYALWRLGVSAHALLPSAERTWVPTRRHREG